MNELTSLVLGPVDELTNYLESIQLSEDKILAQKLLDAFKRVMTLFLHLGIAIGILLAFLVWIVIVMVL